MLRVGDTHSFTYTVPENRTVPELLPEAPEFQQIPRVFATGYMVALIEWTACQHLHPHLAEGQTSVGTLVDVTHEAPTAPGMSVTVEVECTAIDERSAAWSIVATDDAGVISKGRHERAILDRARFERGVQKRAAAVQK